jgi:alkane 1-monooxygenase
MAFVAQAANGGTVTYVDGKRYLWPLSVVVGTIPMIAVALYFLLGGNPLAMLLPLGYIFFVVPMIDAIVGEDAHNPPEEVVPAMARDPYYRVLIYIAVGVLFASFLTTAWFIGTHSLPWWAFLTMTLGTAFNSAAAILLGHELGHKNNRWDRRAAQISNGLVGYGHFCIEHNRGHHVNVATPEDPVSSRMGESIYRFVLREIPGAFRRGCQLEADRLQKLGKGFWSLQNEILPSWLFTLLVGTGLIVAFGWIMVPFLILHHAYAWYGLSQANYVEHYGLLRQRLPNGRYELCEPHHSWNTNHTFSNLTSFHLQRHSDHHANALRPYQTLRDFKNLPRLPSGYPGSFGLAAIPPLWFKVMDRKLMKWAGGDITKINVDPRSREKLYARYGATTTTSPS